MKAIGASVARPVCMCGSLAGAAGEMVCARNIAVAATRPQPRRNPSDGRIGGTLHTDARFERRAKLFPNALRTSWALVHQCFYVGGATYRDANDRDPPSRDTVSLLQYPPRDRVELLEQLGVSRLGRRDQRGVECS